MIIVKLDQFESGSAIQLLSTMIHKIVMQDLKFLKSNSLTLCCTIFQVPMREA